MSTAALLLFDEQRKNRYLEAIGEGRSTTAAARSIGVSPAVIRKALHDDPLFARRELEARREAHDTVEDALFDRAVGRLTPEQVRWHAREKARLEAQAHHRGDEEFRADLDVAEPAPPSPDQKAIEMWLRQRVPDRWADDAQGAGNVTVTVQNLIQADGATDFRQTLEARRQQALHPAMRATGPSPADDATPTDGVPTPP